MNNSVYEEYMRNILGNQTMNSYDMNYNDWEMNNMQKQELENCYPEIYRIVYPMIQQACMKNTQPITRELIDRMNDEIYFALEDKEMVENRNKEEKTEDRQIRRNTNLNDLIRILLLRELLGRPGFPGGRPPRPRPPRPPMRPYMGPYNRNTYWQYNDLYEY